MNKKLIQNTALDQHFLVKKSLIQEEIKLAEVSTKDNILEIGAGNGNLTKELIKTKANVFCFEIDNRYLEDLYKLKKNYNNLEVIYGNALNYSWIDYNKIVSNIPYGISEPLMNKAIKEEVNFLVLIVGEKFKKILKNKNSKTGFIVNLFYDVEYIKKINKKEFYPVPRVNSWLIKLKKKDNLSKKEEILQELILYEGKIKNALIYSLVKQDYTKRRAKEFLENLSLNKNILEKSTKKLTIRLLRRLDKYLDENLMMKNRKLYK